MITWQIARIAEKNEKEKPFYLDLSENRAIMGTKTKWKGGKHETVRCKKFIHDV